MQEPTKTLLERLSEPIPIEQVDFRIQSISPKGWATILAYKDARVDMNRLNKVLGPDGWERSHEFKDGKLYCSVGIWSNRAQRFVYKEDVGTQSITEKEKGQASDSFKRACFNLGIGIELYDYPLILVQLHAKEYKVIKSKNENQKDKVQATWDLKLKQWSWVSEFNNDGKIEALRAFDEKNKPRFQFPRNWTEKKPNVAPAQTAASKPLPYDDLFALITAANSLEQCKAVRPLITASKAAKLLDESMCSQLTAHYKDKQIQLKEGDHG